MRVFNFEVPATKTSLDKLLGDVIRHASTINFQAPQGNTNTIYFGDAKSQPFELRPKANALINHSSVRDVYVFGTPPDRLSVMLT